MTAAAPEVSVICTAKDAGDTIGHTIASIRAQQLQDWEMVVVDDGSSDDTAAVVREEAAADPRIRLIATDGIGRAPALNRALAAARAGLVSNVDADDEVHPRLLACQREALRRHPEFGIVSTAWFRIYGAERPRWPELVESVTYEVADVTDSLLFTNPIYHSSVMMPKATILGLGGYDEQRRIMIDYDLWLRCVAARIRFGRIELPLVAQRIHPGQSYMHTRKLRYFLEGARMQARAGRQLGVRGHHWPLMVLRLGWGMLPLRARLALRDLGVRWRLRQTRLRGQRQ